MGALAAVGLGWGGGGRAPRAESIRFLTIGTGTAGGTYFPIGGILANAISNPPGSPGCDRGGSCGVPGMIAVAQTTSGAVENVEALRTGRYETGLVQADIGFLAYKGKGPYAGKPPFTDLRALANLYSETVHLVVRGDSPIKTVNDLKGRRVALGEKGSGTLPTALLILQAHDLSEKTVQPFYLNPGTAGDRLASGQLDAFFIIGGYPLPAVADVAARLPVRLISIIDARLPRLSPGLPLFTETMIGGDGAYVGVPETKTLGVGAQWLATTALPDELAYGIVKALWHPNTHRLLVAGHPRGKASGKRRRSPAWRCRCTRGRRAITVSRGSTCRWPRRADGLGLIPGGQVIQLNRRRAVPTARWDCPRGHGCGRSGRFPGCPKWGRS
ncbi:TAXI family TRAP transporter solute-binding subunit [Nitrospirillum sp. BR 11828]|nr:TAXI family TRAP transporter solute-binding subunit [Nitrospirillum sp. BR 11828]MDZ5646517.1 TAXI family TRAP transporter solute-binding subunit [Nitrospirillum sp. BR 11828]